MFRSVAATFVVLPLLAQPALAAPHQLYGKTVVVSWNESRDEKFPDEEQMRHVLAVGSMSIYISEAGRPFSRFRYSIIGRRGRVKSGKRDAVSGEGRAVRNFAFSGSTMTALAQRGRGGAIQMIVTFDANFQGCSAHVIAGRQPGSQPIHGKSLMHGSRVDIYRVEASGASCQVQNGNIFAG
jgi:hypothetical protein